MGTVIRGLIAGAAGSSALNIVNYLDMATRARLASRTPQQTAERLADLTGVDLGEGDRAESRKVGVGLLLGYGAGLGAAVCYGLLAGRRRPGPTAALALTVLLMVSSAGPMTALGVTDPRRWSAADWVTDLVPHLAYGAVAAITYDRLR